MLLNELCVSLAKPNIDPEIPAFIPAEALKRLSHGRNTIGRIRVLLSRRKQDTDAPHLLALLRVRRDWPCRRGAAEQRYKIAPNAIRDYNVHLPTHQIGRQFGQPINIASGPAPFDPNSLPINVAGSLQAVADDDVCAVILRAEDHDAVLAASSR